MLSAAAALLSRYWNSARKQGDYPRHEYLSGQEGTGSKGPFNPQDEDLDQQQTQPKSSVLPPTRSGPSTHPAGDAVDPTRRVCRKLAFPLGMVFATPYSFRHCLASFPLR